MAINLVIRAINAVGIFGAEVPTDQSPVWTGTFDFNINVGDAVNIILDNLCQDPEGNDLEYTITGSLPTGLAQSGSRGEFITGTAQAAQTLSFTIEADDTFNDPVTGDFPTRAAAATLGATNFSDVWVNGSIARTLTTKQDVIDEALSIGASSHGGSESAAALHLDLDTTIKLSGAHSLRMNTFNTNGAASGSWAFEPNFTDGTVYRRFYTQFSVYYPRDTIAWRYLLTASSVGQLKVINFGQYGGGQVVVSNWRFIGFPSGFINGSSGMIAANTGNTLGTPNAFGTICYRIQDAIDVGGAVSTQTEMLTRYGPLAGSGMANGMDTAYSSVQPYLDDRVQPAGFPDTRAATNGVPFVLDGWTTIEVFLNYNVSNPSQSTIQMWAAPYGEAPTLIINCQNNVPLSTNTTNSWDHLELLNYDTEREQETERPTQYTYYAELITSEEPINFPGGFTIPGNLG